MLAPTTQNITDPFYPDGYVSSEQDRARITAQKENKEYSIIIGPMLNQDADNLFQILISKGYKQPEIIIK